MLYFSDEEGETDEYECLLASDLGVAIVTEAIRQMAEMRYVIDINVKKKYFLIFTYNIITTSDREK